MAGSTGRGRASHHVVIGAGLAGAATAWQLASRGHEVTVLERDRPASMLGSSHGSARILRYAYDDPFYVRLVRDARVLWDRLERTTGARLVTPTGSVDSGLVRRPAELARVLERVGIEHELMSAREAEDRWPEMTFDSDVLFHPAAGVVDAETAVRTMLDLAVGHGAVVHGGWEAVSVERVGAGFAVTSDDGCRVEGDSVVVGAGAWLPDLLGGALPLPRAALDRIPPLRVRQEQVFHFPYMDGPPARSVPTSIHMDERMQVYALPGGRDVEGRGHKVAEFDGGRVIPSAAHQDGVVDPANRARVVDWVRRNLPGVEPVPYAEATCLFTSTPTEDFVIDRVDGITIVSPCSGHGAKFAPLIGSLAADAATGERVEPRFALAP
ncbi:FAD-dependent oxidoreductase [Clavibacter michiganensis]|uniref:FAD-dependent oxidoreductase n=1 Tax=Clavibacter michiganensis TaxID=28447 RepID=UPI001AE5A546|nr:FAD-dependent oxidoreductase [Clavibacter michiganensis]MBP2456915.1 sarcosine oxidase [Clavibacter michiganensis]MDQ0409485.1 sarcosine oxidase [Clavibacter michiganensis]